MASSRPLSDWRPAPLDPHIPVIGAYLALASFVVSATVRGESRTRLDAPLRWAEVGLDGLAAHKLSRLVSKATVTAPLRSPFTNEAGPGVPGEVNAEPAEEGWRQIVGELLACPFCLDVWAASTIVGGRYLAPRPARMATATLAATAIADFAHFGYTALAHLAEGTD